MGILSAIIFLLLSLSAHAEEIKYEIYEISTGKLLASGVRRYSSKDVISFPYEVRGEPVVEKYVELGRGYKVGARIFREPRLTGFGLVAQLTRKDFSWEWYNKKEGSLFQKLQGQTYVTVRTSGLPVVEILEEVKFLDDTKLSFCLGGPGNDESHDIIIKKGSVLRFD